MDHVIEVVRLFTGETIGRAQAAEFLAIVEESSPVRRGGPGFSGYAECAAWYRARVDDVRAGRRPPPLTLTRPRLRLIR